VAHPPLAVRAEAVEAANRPLALAYENPRGAGPDRPPGHAYPVGRDRAADHEARAEHRGHHPGAVRRPDRVSRDRGPDATAAKGPVAAGTVRRGRPAGVQRGVLVPRIPRPGPFGPVPELGRRPDRFVPVRVPAPGPPPGPRGHAPGT